MRRPRGACIVASRGLELEVTIRGSGTLAASALARHCKATGVSLLYLTIYGAIHIPCYDNNGNITRYLNANGGTFARYSYDAFGTFLFSLKYSKYSCASSVESAEIRTLCVSPGVLFLSFIIAFLQKCAFISVSLRSDVVIVINEFFDTVASLVIFVVVAAAVFVLHLVAHVV